jgi:hypothetical protein
MKNSVHKKKRLSWNLKLSNNLLIFLKTILVRCKQEIALTFIQKYPHLDFKTLQIKWHFIHFEY